MATRGVRLGVTGATGALGTEVLAALDAARLPIAQLVAVAGERSLGAELEFQGDARARGDRAARAARARSRDPLRAARRPRPTIARAALRAEVPCIDCSGAFAQRAEVPLACGRARASGSRRAARSPRPSTPRWSGCRSCAALAPLGALARVRGDDPRGRVGVGPRRHRRALARVARAVQLAGAARGRGARALRSRSTAARPAASARRRAARARGRARGRARARARSRAGGVGALDPGARVRGPGLRARRSRGSARVDAGEAARAARQGARRRALERRRRGPEPARGRGPRRRGREPPRARRRRAGRAVRSGPRAICCASRPRMPRALAAALARRARRATEAGGVARTFRLTLEYDGTEFEGWQIQPGGRRTVQGELEIALARVTRERVRAVGSGPHRRGRARARGRSRACGSRPRSSPSGCAAR